MSFSPPSQVFYASNPLTSPESLLASFERCKKLWNPLLAVKNDEARANQNNLLAAEQFFKSLADVAEANRREEDMLAEASRTMIRGLTEQALGKRRMQSLPMRDGPRLDGEDDEISVQSASGSSSARSDDRREKPIDPAGIAGNAIAGVATFHADGTGRENFS